MVNGILLNFGKRYKDGLRVMFDQWLKLHLLRFGCANQSKNIKWYLKVQWNKSKSRITEEALHVSETFQKLCCDSTGQNMVNFFKKIMDTMRKQKASNNGHVHIIYIRTVSSWLQVCSGTNVSFLAKIKSSTVHFALPNHPTS